MYQSNYTMGPSDFHIITATATRHGVLVRKVVVEPSVPVKTSGLRA